MECPHAAKKIGAIFFKRTAISRKPEALTRTELRDLRAEDQLTPDLEI